MSKYPYGKQLIIDNLQKNLDAIEKYWSMTGSYERVDPYVIPMLQGDAWFELIIYHIESKLWFDKSYFDLIVHDTKAKNLVRPGTVAFDIGCNSGAITLPLAMLAGPEGHVHAFDPYPWNAAATLANAHYNHFFNVTSYPVGLSNATQRINVSPNDSRIYAESSATNSQSLDIRHIRDFMHLKPQFLKIDIEGAEHELFDVADASIYNSVETAALEFHPMWITPRGIDCKDTLRNIQKCEFDLHYYSIESAPYDIDTFSQNEHMFWLKHKMPAKA